ncbi:hypothetical protein VNI00_017032 [Paramarasmius palmivorus]|uniref:F-box domain-containing protein n=1 Tax=Paramarasmius palmivorus TaxID=297713 RepID=A0AAW0B990_9AGAR
MPPEIMREIFLRCPHSKSTLSPTDTPWTLTRVNRSWRIIASKTSELWRTVHIDNAKATMSNITSLIPLAMERTNEQPIDVTFDFKPISDLAQRRDPLFRSRTRRGEWKKEEDIMEHAFRTLLINTKSRQWRSLVTYSTPSKSLTDVWDRRRYKRGGSETHPRENNIPHQSSYLRRHLLLDATMVAQTRINLPPTLEVLSLDSWQIPSSFNTQSLRVLVIHHLDYEAAGFVASEAVDLTSLSNLTLKSFPPMDRTILRILQRLRTSRNLFCRDTLEIIS